MVVDIRMTRTLGAALAAVLLAAITGCGGEQGAELPSATAAVASASALESATAPPASAKVSQAEPTPIGYAKLPPAIPSEATLANLKALQAHNKKQWDQARAGFEEAARLAPHYGIARFNLACALSRTGDVSGATVQCFNDFCPRLYGYELEVGSLYGEPNPGPKRKVADDGDVTPENWAI